MQALLGVAMVVFGRANGVLRKFSEPGIISGSRHQVALTKLARDGCPRLGFPLFLGADLWCEYRVRHALSLQ